MRKEVLLIAADIRTMIIITLRRMIIVNKRETVIMITRGMMISKEREREREVGDGEMMARCKVIICSYFPGSGLMGMPIKALL